MGVPVELLKDGCDVVSGGLWWSLESESRRAAELWMCCQYCEVRFSLACDLVIVCLLSYRKPFLVYRRSSI